MPTPLPPNDHSPSLQTSLLLRLRTPDHAAWQRWTHLYGPLILDWCRLAGLQPEDAADVQQDVFRAVVTHIADFRREQPGDSFRGWLYRITQNKIRDHWRRQHKDVVASGGTDHQQMLLAVPGEAASEVSLDENAQETGQLFRRALELLQTEFEPRTWQAFWRVTIEGQEVAEVAQTLGMSPGAIYVAKSRILRRFREEFSDLMS